MLATGPQPDTEVQHSRSIEQVPAPPLVSDVREKSVVRLRQLWNERRLLKRAIGAGLAIGVTLAFLLPTRYQSSARLMPPDAQSPTSGMAMLAALTAKTSNAIGALSGDLLGVQGSGDLFVAILRSRTVEDRLIQRFDLRRVYGVRLEEDARKQLTDSTNIGNDRKSGVIVIAVTDRDRQRATAITRAYVEELDRLVAELSTSAAHRERVFLESRLKAVKQDLDQASREFSQFASENTAIDIKEQGRAMVEAAARLQGELIAAESQLKGLEAIYADKNVRVRSAQARVSELRRQLEKLGGDKLKTTDQSGGPNDSLYPSIRSLPILGVPYADLLGRVKIQQAVFESLTQEYELAKVREARDTPSVKVLDAPDMPERRSFPPRILIVFLSTFGAVVGVAFWIFARYNWEQAEATDPGKVFAREVYQAVNTKMPWTHPNGSRLHNASHRAWMRLSRHLDREQKR